MARSERIYAMYKGDKFLAEGTAQELADFHGVTRATILWYSYPTYQKRSKKNTNRIVVFEI